MSSAGSLFCYLCPPGSFSPSPQSPSCTICPSGLTSLPASTSCPLYNIAGAGNLSSFTVTPSSALTATSVMAPSVCTQDFESPLPYLTFSPFLPPAGVPGNVSIPSGGGGRGCTRDCNGGTPHFPGLPFIPFIPFLPGIGGGGGGGSDGSKGGGGGDDSDEDEEQCTPKPGYAEQP